MSHRKRLQKDHQVVVSDNGLLDLGRLLDVIFQSKIGILVWLGWVLIGTLVYVCSNNGR
jgi:hypothetical protein